MPVMYQLEAIKRFAPSCRYYNAGSSEQWGNVDYSPQDINHPCKPRSPYGVSKCAAHNMVKVWRESYGLYAVQGILLNHEGVRRGHEFVTRKISLGVARIKRAIDRGVKFDPIELGNLSAQRDWSDSEDFVDGIWKMLNQQTWDRGDEKGRGFPRGTILKPKEYVLSSNETHTIKEFVELAFAALNISGEWSGHGLTERYEINRNDVISPLVKVNPKFYRPNEVDLLWGDSTPARGELGWNPQVNFNQLVEKMVKHDYETEHSRL